MDNKSPILSVLSIGSEILDGRIFDTNSRFLMAEGKKNGCHLGQILSCSDVLSEIGEALEYLRALSDIIVVSGGLGPTKDDLTREALAQFSQSELFLDENALLELKAKFAHRKREFPESNTVQAYFPKASTVVKNPIGTADGFCVRSRNAAGREVFIYCLPGVPKELQLMWTTAILPEIERLYPEREALSSRQMRLFGLPESEVGRRVVALGLSENLAISYRASFPEIQLQITGLDEQEVQAAQQEIICGVGEEFFFSRDGERSLEGSVHELLRAAQKTFSAAESCTGGLLSELLCQHEGASAYFLGSVVSYSNSAKEKFLDVPASLLSEYGAVSAEVVEAMVRGAQKRFSSDYALSITGVAGPSGGTEEKPVGTFFVGLATPSEVLSQRYLFVQERSMVQRYAAYSALELLRRRLLFDTP